jgi:hypothetical protein
MALLIVATAPVPVLQGDGVNFEHQDLIGIDGLRLCFLRNP